MGNISITIHKKYSFVDINHVWARIALQLSCKSVIAVSACSKSYEPEYTAIYSIRTIMSRKCIVHILSCSNFDETKVDDGTCYMLCCHRYW